jgi:amidase
METGAELCGKTLVETAALLQRRELSPVELTRLVLERIGALDGTLHSFITVTAEPAMAQAGAAEAEIQRGRYRGPLHGMPIAVKDLCYTKGVRTTCGSKILADWVPDHDAAVVEKLQAAGAVILGKLGMTEFAYGGYHPTVPPPVNPRAPDRWPGASSSGSGSATAAGLCFGSLGSDTGGSIRFPSAACGIVGVKPTYGRVSRHGVFPLAASLDHIGPMTRSVADAAAMLGAIAGLDARDPTTRREPVPDYLAALADGARGLRIGVDETFCTEGTVAEVSGGVLASVRVLREQGADVREVRVRGLEAAARDWYVVCAVEAAVAHERTYPSRAADYGATFRALLEDGVRVSGVEYARIQEARQAVCRAIDDLWQEVDLLLCPSMPALPPPIAETPPDAILGREQVAPLLRFTAPFDWSGSPTISVPCGVSDGGLPLSLQIVGRHGEEATVLRAGHAYEQATDWHRRPLPV